MVISVSNVSFVTFDGFKIDCARQTAIFADNGIIVCFKIVIINYLILIIL